MRTVVVAEDRGVTQPCHMPYAAEDCVEIHGPHGSYQRCDALHERNGRCARWAARTVRVWRTDEHSHQLGCAFAERAVCWEHLPAAIVWAERLFSPASHELRLGQPWSGSTEPPAGGGGWDFDLPRRAPDCCINLAEPEQEG